MSIALTLCCLPTACSACHSLVAPFSILRSPFSSLDCLFCSLFSFKRLFYLNELCVSIKMQRLRYDAQRANRFAPPAQAPSSLLLPFPHLCVSSELAGQVELSLRMPRYKMHLQQIPRVSVRLTCPVNPLLASLPSLSLPLSSSLTPLLTFSVCLTTNLPIVLLN